MAKMIEIGNTPAYLALPPGECKGGLIVIHEVWGLTEHITNVADRFAAEGYCVLAPDLLSETGLTEKVTPGLQEDLFNPERRNAVQPVLRELMTPLREPGFAEGTVNKLQNCFEHLMEQDMVGGRVATVGFCFGGTYSFSLAVAEPRLKAAVPFYGHSEHSAEELKNIKCPVLAFYGENDDRLVMGLPDLKNRMDEAGVDFTAQVYPDCGHAFFNDTNRFAYSQSAAEDAWRRALDFLETNI